MIRASEILESLQSVLRIDERNIANIDEIETWIRVQFLKKTPHDEVKKWLTKTLRNYMISDYKGISQIHSVPRNAPSWLAKALERGDPVFEIDIGSSLDEFEDQIFQAIETMNNLYPSRDYDKMVKSPVDVVLEKTREHLKRRDKFEGIEETGLKYSDGSRWVRLLTVETIENEGQLLANCLKDNPVGYADRIEKREGVLWSLRDSHDKPIVHIETKGHKVVQIAGFANGVVSVEYRGHVRDLFEKEGFTSFESGALKNIKSVYYKGKLYDETMVPGSYEMGKSLMSAVTTDSYDAARWALSNDADPNEPFEKKLPLTEAARRGFLGIVKLLLEYEADIEGKDESGQSALFAASIYLKQTEDTVRYLLRAGADPDTFDNAGNTPLSLAAIHNQPELAEIMIRAGAEIDKKNRYGYSAAVLAIENDSREPFEILVDAGADTDILVDNKPVVYQVVVKGWLRALEKMLSNGIDPNTRSQDGTTLLMMAASSQKKSVVEILLKYRADPNLKDSKGQTALDRATRAWFKSPDPQIIDMLKQSMEKS